MVLREPNPPKNSVPVDAAAPRARWRPSRRFWIVLCGVVAVIVLLFGFGVYRWGWRGPTTRIVTRLVPYPAAIVNGSVIRFADFEEDVRVLETFYQNAKTTAPAGSVFPTQAEIEERVLDRLIKDRLAEQAAARYGISVRASDVEAAYRDTILDQSALDTAGGRARAEARAEATLRELYGLSASRFKSRILTPFLVRQALERAIVADEELNEEKSKKAEAAAEALRSGEPFNEVAALYSEDPNAAGSGGERGWIVPGLMPPEVDAVIFTLDKEGVSDIVRSPLGFHVFRAADLKTSGGKTTSVLLQEILIQPISLDAYLDARLKTASVIKFVP